MIIEGPLRASSLFSCALGTRAGKNKKEKKGRRAGKNKKEKKGRRAQDI